MFSAAAAILSVSASLAYAQTTGTDGVVLRDLADSRFFGAAANTTFLFHDKNYTEVISTQVCVLLSSSTWTDEIYSIPFSPLKMRVSNCVCVRSHPLSIEFVLFNFQ